MGEEVVYPLRRVTVFHPSHGFGFYRTVDLECGHQLAVPANQVSKVRTKVRCKKCDPVVRP